MRITLTLDPMFWLMVALCGACGAMIVIIPIRRRMRALESLVDMLCKKIIRLSRDE